MIVYKGKFKCGHSCEVELNGSESDVEIAKLMNIPCPMCFKTAPNGEPEGYKIMSVKDKAPKK